MNCLRQKRNNPTKEFLTFLLREHLSILEKHKDFIYLCIQHDVDTVDIMTLVNQEFPYDLEDIQLCLDKGDIKLLKYLAYHLKEDNIYDVFTKLYKFLKLYNNNYRPIYHIESFIFYLCIKIHGL